MTEQETSNQKQPDQSQETDQQDSQDADQSPSESDDQTPDQLIKPFDQKVGEGRDNLRRREEWFQRRTGGK